LIEELIGLKHLALKTNEITLHLNKASMDLSIPHQGPVKGPFPNKKYCQIMQNFIFTPYFDSQINSQNGTKNTIPKTP
jgi:5-methylthioribose kinase